MKAKLFHFLKAFATKITFETPGYFLLCHIPAFTHLPALGVEHLHPFIGLAVCRVLHQVGVDAAQVHGHEHTQLLILSYDNSMQLQMCKFIYLKC